MVVVTSNIDHHPCFRVLYLISQGLDEWANPRLKTNFSNVVFKSLLNEFEVN